MTPKYKYSLITLSFIIGNIVAQNAVAQKNPNQRICEVAPTNTFVINNDTTGGIPFDEIYIHNRYGVATNYDIYLHQSAALLKTLEFKQRFNGGNTAFLATTLLPENDAKKLFEFLEADCSYPLTDENRFQIERQSRWGAGEYASFFEAEKTENGYEWTYDPTVSLDENRVNYIQIGTLLKLVAESKNREEPRSAND